VVAVVVEERHLALLLVLFLAQVESALTHYLVLPLAQVESAPMNRLSLAAAKMGVELALV